MCTYIHIHTYSRIDTSVDKKLYFVLVCVCTYHMILYIHMHIHMHTYAYICIHMHTYAYICIHMHTYAYICTKQIQVAFWSEHVEVWPYTPVQHRVPGHFNYGFQHQAFSNRGARPEWSVALGPAHPKEYPEERAKNQNPWATSKGSSPIVLGFDVNFTGHAGSVLQRKKGCLY